MGESDVEPVAETGAEIVAAIEAVYRERFPEFVRVAAAICGDVDTGADAVQDAFASALRTADRYRADGPLDGWLWRAVVNTARNQRRGVRRLSRREAAHGVRHRDAITDPSSDPAVRRLVAALPERQRLVVFLRYYGELGYAEIAQALAIAPGTVGATLNQAHAALRTAMDQEANR